MDNISNLRKDNFRKWLKAQKKLLDATVDNYIRTLEKYNSDNYRIANTGQIFSQFQSISFSLFAIDDYSVIEKILITIGEDNSNNYEIKGAQGWRDDHRTLYNAIKQYVEFLQQGNHVNVTSEPENKQLAYNAIFFGAPGTGKSYKLNNIVKQQFGKRYERVTFYADYLHSQFVGAYKPITVPTKNKEGDEIRTIEYQFRPGPFTRVLIRALNDPDNDYALVIEELNRAEAASVFGDVFQLLDRGDNGCSEYAITVSEDLLEYLKQTEAGNDNYLTDAGRSRLRDLTGQMDQIDCSQIVIPSNMYILATMNSADQGVFPLDTAFKRRWDFEYVGIDDGESARDANGDCVIHDQDWATHRRKIINEHLLAAGIPEDKQLGPFFLGNPSLKYGMEGFNKAMKNKVIMYLYEDAAKDYLNKVFTFDAIRALKLQDQTDYYSLSTLFEAWDIINYGIFSGLDSCPDKKDDSDSEGKQDTADDSANASDGSAQDSNE